jgi:hypothetical protein
MSTSMVDGQKKGDAEMAAGIHILLHSQFFALDDPHPELATTRSRSTASISRHSSSSGELRYS